MYRVFFAGKRKCTKQTLNISNFHSNYWQTGKKVPFKLKQFFLQTSKISINRHSYLVTMHASYSKTQHQSPIQYKADVSLEERENQKGSQHINKKSELWNSVQDFFRISMYKTSLKNLCSLNCCYKYTFLSKFLSLAYNVWTLMHKHGHFSFWGLVEVKM